jgi:hypothetical protein
LVLPLIYIPTQRRTTSDISRVGTTPQVLRDEVKLMRHGPLPDISDCTRLLMTDLLVGYGDEA